MITISPLFRIPFIAIAVGLHHHALSPSNGRRRPASQSFKRDDKSLSEKTVFSNVVVSTGLQQLIVAGLGLAEIVAIVQHRFNGRPGVDTPFFVGTGLVITGGLIREWCFRAMGEMFTFETGLRQDHCLVVSGPYAFVRHPSYVGAYLMLTGLFIWQAGDGSWIRESEALQTWPGKGFVAFCIAFAMSKVTAFAARTKAEDRILEDHFGDEWRAWASKVCYRLIPYVY